MTIRTVNTPSVAPAQTPLQSRPRKPEIAADYFKASNLSVGDKLSIFAGAVGGGGLAAGTVSIFPAGVAYGAGLILEHDGLANFGETMLLSTVAAGLASGVLTAGVKSARQGAILGTVVGTGVGAVTGALKGGVTGAVINGALGAVSGMAGGYFSSSIHSSYRW